MAAIQARGPTTPPPPPVIGKAGRYTIFITPPATPSPPPEKKPLFQSPITPGPVAGPLNAPSLPGKSAAPEAPPVQVPPPHFKKQASKGPSLFGFLWDAVAKVQNAHSSLDEYLAEWLGLNQSKYQWALDDYYENTSSSKDCGKPKDQVSKDQTV